ncbi:MAG: 2-phospho-L-lactate transferase [Candidatus Methanoliparum thermophilum]|uniref:2-phospho-L-lactate transferase n=2 Tax=Candidatus Methanoliparum TaxID=2545692 RepID=A0A520KT87_METT2|nr:MAG: 2-phospho-L-lactate transferase [Candidatus Methanoliparum thermophilum]BDC36000.1 2-phospho-L-lactate transferase [Candidatus Methanoliparum sp. LAM-1]
MIVLSGGTGTPKLISGLKQIDEDFNIIVNTGEDYWISGNLISPDIDSVIYTLAGIIDKERWWGIKDDTFVTHEEISRMAYNAKVKGEWMQIGDLDRATHIFRSDLIRENKNKTEATLILAKYFGIKQKVLPMCNEDINTIIKTGEGEMHFQEFWVYRRGEPLVEDVYFRNIEKAKITKEIDRLLKEEDTVLIGPSNPISSILPILSVENFRERLKDKYVISISPIIGEKPISGPAASFMQVKGLEVSSNGVAEFYKDILDVFVVDYRDNMIDKKKIKDIDLYATDILIENDEKSKKLAQFIRNLL